MDEYRLRIGSGRGGTNGYISASGKGGSYGGGRGYGFGHGKGTGSGDGDGVGRCAAERRQQLATRREGK
jgi:hypothetical protein